MKNLRFGVEVELDNLSLVSAKETVEDYLEGPYDHLGREWKVCADASVPNGFELVTPPMYYADIVLMQEIFRRLRLRGARRSSDTGVHVHVSAREFSPQQLVSLINLYASYSELFIKMLNVYSHRRLLFCQPVLPFAKKLSLLDEISFDAISTAWYGDNSQDTSNERYDETRYTELNIHSYFYRRTVEFRAFNSTNHAGKIKSFIVLAIALVSYAQRYSGVIPLAPVITSDQNNALTVLDDFFTRVGLNPFEFRNVRRHLRDNVLRHYRARKGTGKQAYIFSSEGLSFDGGTATEVLEEMIDNYFFEQEIAQEFLLQIRQSRRELESEKPEIGEFPLISEILDSVIDTETFAQKLLRLLESLGYGQLTIL